MTKRPKPIVLTVLDGWGYRAETKANAIALARKPHYDRLLAQFPNTLIQTSGPAVGLPAGQMGNSEVGHLNIGAGRIVQMDITRVDQAIASGALLKNELLLAAMHRGREHQLHLMGLLSDGGVHSHIEHLFALLAMAKQNKVERVFIHCFLDGRDTPPHSGIDYLRRLEQKLRELGTGRIASVSGRYYAMDRDNRWERVERAYRAVVHGEADRRVADPVAALRASYEQGVTDEFIVPMAITKGPDPAVRPSDADPVACVREDDAVIYFNFRADRARQMARAIAEPGFDKFTDLKRPKNLFFVGMTQYDKTFAWLHFLFGAEKLEHILAQVFAEVGFRNLRIAETEKYAHVTYFFNGGVEKPFEGEERILVASQKVPTYDLKPEMSAAGITDGVIHAIESGSFDAVVMNFANADMVRTLGATWKLPSVPSKPWMRAWAGCFQTLRPRGGAWIITADHGNAETMIDPITGEPHTYHTTNPVPFVMLDEDSRNGLKPGGSLQDIAPTLLGMLGVEQPAEMTGRDLRVVHK